MRSVVLLLAAGLCLGVPWLVHGADPAPRPRLGLLEAVRSTLTQDPVLANEQQNVEGSRGRLQSATGQFDTRLGASVARNLDNRSVVTSTSPTSFNRLTVNETSYRASVDKPLRSGVLLSPGLEMIHGDDNISGQGPLNRAAVSFLVVVPLARGFGEKAVAAQERSARIELEAARQTYRHRVSERVLNTTLAYWGYAAALQQLDIVKESEARAKRLVEQMQALAKADELPRAELDKLAASLANNVAHRISAEQALVEARQVLGLAMGAPFEQLAALPPPGDDFPALAGNELPEQLGLERLIGEAFQRRTDLAAALQSKSSAQALVDAARNGLKPRVDLNLKVGYAGIDGGDKARNYFTPFGENVEGVNALGVLSFDFPPANNVARGQLLQTESASRQAVIRADELARQIRAGILVSMDRLRNGALQLSKAEEATRLYQTSVVNEKTKLNLGMATVLDVLQLEDRLTAASLSYLGARASYATALAQLRFDTGTLVRTEAERGTVDWRSLTTVPFTEPARP